jgi:hypothetical protein
MTLPDYISVGFAVLVILVAGMTVFYGLEREPENYFRLERLAYCWPLGMAALGMPMFLLSLCGYKLNVLVIIGGVAGAAAIVFGLRRAPVVEYWRCRSKYNPPRERLTEFEWMLIVIIVACLGARIVASSLTPMYDWDGVCTWGVKAKILFYGSLKSSMKYFQLAEFRCINQNYPLLWPLMYTWVCTVLGRWDDLAMIAVINPLNLVTLVGLLYFTLRKSNSRTVTLLVASLASSLPTTIHYTVCAQADVPLMLLSGASLFLLFDWMRHRRRGSILLAAVLMGGAMFTKEEGRLVFVAQCGGTALVILTLWKSAERRKLLGQWVAFVVIAGLWVLPWLLFRRTIHVWEQYFGPLGLSTLRWREIPNLWRVMLHNTLVFYNGVGLPKWNFLWPVVVLFLLASKAPRQAPWNFVMAILLLHVFGLSIVYLCSYLRLVPGENEFAYERNVLSMLPPVWLVLAQCVDEWWAVWKRPARQLDNAGRLAPKS